MITGMGNMEIKDSHLAMGFARITEPVSMGSPTHKHPHDQWIWLIGEPEHFDEFDADVEMTLGKKDSENQLSLLHLHTQERHALPTRR